MARKELRGGEAAICAVTGQRTVAGHRVTFSIDDVRSAAEGGYRHYALEAPPHPDGRIVDEYWEGTDGKAYDALSDLPPERVTDLPYVANLRFVSLVVEEFTSPGTAAASLRAVAEDVAADGRSGWLIWNPQGRFLMPTGDEEAELAEPCRIRIPGGEDAAAVERRIMAGGATRVKRRIELDGQVVEVAVSQQVIPPLAGAWESIRAARDLAG